MNQNEKYLTVYRLSNLIPRTLEEFNPPPPSDACRYNDNYISILIASTKSQ
jgi:hypothetical protein